MIAAFFDVDGTLTNSRVWSGLIDYFPANRIKLGVHYLFNTIHYFLYFVHKVGFLNQSAFREIWAKDLAWYFKGFSVERSEEVWEWVIENRLSGQWREDVVAQLRKHKEEGAVIFLVSGGPIGLLERIAKEVGADHVVGTRHEVVNGVYTGRALGAACQGVHKPQLVKEKVKTLGLEIDWDSSFAYADSVSDVQLLELVGNPVAVYPEEGVRELAAERGWTIFER
ncbi:MAG TPA: HAD-IB family hydrolase [Anaerolineales bacterium]|nr:HAD-IB family hydrolase [Anaerolineales bacterium]